MRLSKEPDVEFDLHAYHDLVLKNGALPMNLLEENARAWIKQQKACAAWRIFRMSPWGYPRKTA